MPNFDGFREYLRRKGKRDHVVDDLIKRCITFEQFLLEKRKPSMANSGKEDILAFLDEIRGQKSGVNNYLRAISLYYRFASRPDLSTFVSNLREQRLSSARKSFPLKGFRGIDRNYVKALAKKGITNADQILEIGKTPANRQELSDKTGVPTKAILELVKLSDLSRIEGVKGIRARLYHDAGVDTVDKMANCNPQGLRLHMIEFVERTGFKGIPPLPKEVKFTIEAAKKLPKLVRY